MAASREGGASGRVVWLARAGDGLQLDGHNDHDGTFGGVSGALVERAVCLWAGRVAAAWWWSHCPMMR
eukprot:1585089-Prymnesium_polylepis.4